MEKAYKVIREGATLTEVERDAAWFDREELAQAEADAQAIEADVEETKAEVAEAESAEAETAEESTGEE